MMRAFWDALRALMRDDRGASLVEYALVASALALATIVILRSIQSTSGTQLMTTGSNLTNNAVSPP